MPKPVELPKGSRPEEFYRDADLLAYYEAQAEADPDSAELKAQLLKARVAAAMTDAAIGAVEAEAAAPKKK